MDVVRRRARQRWHLHRHVPSPREKAITAARVKNDAVDARTLAHLLRTEPLREA
jgi:hypothetical protein